MIQPNQYVNPAEAIAPNGKYLIKFNITKVARKQESAVAEDLENPNSLSDHQRIKKDALYKPLLRKFRSFLRKSFQQMGLAKHLSNQSAE